MSASVKTSPPWVMPKPFTIASVTSIVSTARPRSSSTISMPNASLARSVSAMIVASHVSSRVISGFRVSSMRAPLRRPALSGAPLQVRRTRVYTY
ncbi:hypothetical protein [Agrococcus sp. Marseille-Q4369]|uniref:hypothetical protein n=1 Tax=Agrococcus sp. Marseille-Q4369 TaxID=2810513 RepID=UPI0020162F1B|nr:hypothetical protein [Agrococcus sp. Marseille-Q4369]